MNANSNRVFEGGNMKETQQKLGPNQQAWVDALRSGNFKQITGALQDDGGYCCLGVACEVAGKNGVDIRRYATGEIWGGDLYGQKYVMDWLQIREGRGYIDEERNLVRYNDVEGLSFTKIADIIEQSAHLLFKAEA